MRAKSLLRLPRGNVGARHPDFAGTGAVPLQSAEAPRRRSAGTSLPRIVDRPGLLVKVINSQVRINQWVLIIRLIKGGAN